MTQIEQSLKVIGKNEYLRNKFIGFIREVESTLPNNGTVRETVTKHLVDAMFEKDDYVIKPIQNGIKYKFLTGIQSKIAREFLLSKPEIPEFAWEPQTTKLLLYLAQSAQNVFIGGAYFGDQAIPIAKRIQENKGHVYAFDLNERQIEILRDNAKLNELDNIVAEVKGLWNNSETFLNISDADDLAFATPAPDAHSSNTTTIDDYVEKNNISSVDLIMIDVEGSEYNILQGARKQLERSKGYPNIVFEIHRSYVDWSNGLANTDLLKFLKSYGYHIFSIRDFQANFDMKGKPIELILPEETYLEGPPHGFNMLAVKDANLLKNDLFRFCKNVSPKYIVHKDPRLHHPQDGFNS